MTSNSPRVSSVNKSTKSLNSSDIKSSLNLKTSTKKMIPLKYSCEEIHERMSNGLCIFCDEKDSPSHRMKHKNLQIVIVDREDDDHVTAELEKLQESNGIVEYQKDSQHLEDVVTLFEEYLMEWEKTSGFGERENKGVHKTTTTEDKRLQRTLKRVRVISVPAVEEVNIFKDNVVIQFIKPQVQISLPANTCVVSGTPQTKRLDNFDSVEKLEENN